jgi:hypothetical protein
MEAMEEPASARRVRIRFAAAAPLLLVGLGAAQILLGEVIPVGGGVGWDGRFYAEIATDLPAALSTGSIDAYRLRRLLPSALVYLFLQASGLPRDLAHAREVFAWLNLGFQLLTLAAWTGISRRTGIGEGGRWLGFVLLFLNFANAKMPYYYAPLTDSGAQALGAAALYFHLAGRAVPLLAILALGAFTWPSFLAFGAFLFVYPTALREERERPAPTWWGRSVAAAACAAFLALAFAHRKGVAESAGPMAVVVVLAYLYRVVNDLLGGSLAPRRYLDRAVLARWGIVALMALSVAALSGAVAAAALFGPGYFLRHLAIYSLSRPAVFLVAHAAYFGLLVPVLIVFWRPAVAAAHRLGPGVTLFVLAHLVWGIHSESRQLIDALPALVLLAVLAALTVQWPPHTVAAAAVLGLIVSKAWLPINREGFIGRSDPATYPAQYYFLNQGPWMAYGPYLIQGATLVIVCMILFVARRRLPLAASPAAAVPPLDVSRGLVRVSMAVVVLAAAVAFIEAGARIQVRGVSDDARTPSEERVPPPRANGAARLPGRSKAPGARRVLVLGDDFIASDPRVPGERTVRSTLETALAAAGTRDEVIALAQAGGTAEEEMLFRCEGLAHDPDVVVLFFRSDDLAENGTERDVECRADGGERSDVRPRARERWRLDTRPWRGSVALRLLGNWAMRHSAGLHGWMVRQGLAERADPPPSLWGYGPMRELRSWWARSEDLLARLAREAAPRRLLVFYVPQDFEVDGRAWDLLLRRYAIGRQRWDRSKVVDRLREVCGQLSIPLVDPRRALVEAQSTGPVYAADGTWTMTGRTVAARELAHALTAGTPSAP